MNVLEKILEEVKDAEKAYVHGHNALYALAAAGMAIEISDIIRSHMNNLLDTDTEEKYILCTLGEDGVLSEYDDTYDVTIHCSSKEDQDQTIELIKRFNWIPVSEHLPEVPEGIDDNDCPEFNVTIKGADKATTLKYSPDGIWFDDSGEMYQVVAWKPFPDPYKPDEG